MARLPRRPSSIPPQLPLPHEVDPAKSLVDERYAAKEDPAEEVPFDEAVEAMLAAGGIDAVTRVQLSRARHAIAEAGGPGAVSGFDGPNLSHALFRFVMPRLRHPAVLRADRHRSLLERLADGLAGVPDDGIAEAGARAIHRELHRLAIVRTARNALVEG